MTVEIEVFGQLLPGQPRCRFLEIQGPAKVRDLAQKIGIDPAEIGLITIDGVQSSLDQSVHSDSRLCLFPYLSGG